MIADVVLQTGVFDDTRFYGTIPKYEQLHFREYLASQDGYRVNQPEDVQFNYQMRKNLEQRLMLYIFPLSQSEKVNLIGNIVPEFGEVLDRLRQVTTKYETLLTRMNPVGMQSTLLSIHGQKVRELLQNDRYAKKIKLVDDF